MIIQMIQKTSNFMQKNLAAGIIILLPFALTYYVISTLYSIFLYPALTWLAPFANAIYDICAPEYISNTFDNPLVISIIKMTAPIMVIFVFVLIIGFFMKYILVKRIFSIFDLFIHQIPMVSLLYQTTREVVNIFMNNKQTSFKSVVLVPWGNARVIGFLNNQIEARINGVSKIMCIVFVPTVPSPISGFLLIFDPSEIVHVNIPVEDAFKFILSFGMIHKNVSNFGFFPPMSGSEPSYFTK